jgi:hypothetical protein
MSAVVTSPGDAVSTEVPPPCVKECDVCGSEIAISARWCKECEAPQKGHACRNCGAVIPIGATVCKSCDAFQDWRRSIPGDQVTLALLVAVFTALGALAPYVIKFINLPSKTSGLMLKMDPNPDVTGRSFMVVRLTNDGGRPAKVERARIEIPIGDSKRSIDFDIKNRESMVVAAGSTSDVNLFATEIPDAPSGLKEVQALAAALCKAKVNIYVGMRERSRVFGTLMPEKEIEAIEVPSTTARDWVFERIIVDGFEKRDC